jgi:endonuclease-8
VPEGDTIHKAAYALSRVLDTKPLLEVRVAHARATSLKAGRVRRVEARGKNLLVWFDDGNVLWTHMGMHGSWHVYRPGERWQRPESTAKAVLRTDDFVCVCFGPRRLELLRDVEIDSTAHLRSLGPDVLGESFDAAEALARMRREPEREIGDALLQQHLLAGVGNVYKSEVLFVCRLNPFLRVAELSDDQLSAVIDACRRSMQANLHAGPRRTRAGALAKFWVYDKSGTPCARCGSAIRMKRQGVAGRSTYFCPRCQSAVGSE